MAGLRRRGALPHRLHLLRCRRPHAVQPDSASVVHERRGDDARGRPRASPRASACVMRDLAADLRFAARILLKDRWFAAGAILTLALAMGVANTTFITTYANLRRDLPFERPDRIAIMRIVDGRGRIGGVSYPDFEDWRRDARVFDGRAAAFTAGTISLGRD